MSSILTKVVDETTHTSLLRFSTAGSVDDGKSTLIGRLLHDSNNVLDDHLEALHANARKSGSKKLSLALLTDGLKAEREQGITIDVAYRYFSTAHRRFILADSPGHVQYTRNMATGASTADLTIILIDAGQGVVEQTKRHAFIAALLGVPRLLIAVNKMDLVDFSEDRFDAIRSDFTEFAARLGVREVRFIPVSALDGDNIVTKSSRMQWYSGETVLEYLESVYIAGDQNLVDFRFPVQYVLNPRHDFRGYAGTISSGVCRVGEEIVAIPSLRRSRIKSIVYAGRQLEHQEVNEASCRESVVIQLEDQIDISRGDMIVRPKNVPRIVTSFEAMIVWLGESQMDPSTRYLIRHTSRETKGFISSIEYKIDIQTLGRTEAAPLAMNEIGRVSFITTAPLFLDAYQKNRATGNFIVIDPATFATVGAGMIIDRVSSDETNAEADQKGHITDSALHTETGLVTRAERESRAGGRAVTLWLTGLSGSGKSSIAKGAERALFDQGLPVFFLDGDNVRHGLNRDLGFTQNDRSENIRRVAEVASLLNQAGTSVICSFISPYRADREIARSVVGAESFIEVHVSASLEVCEARDPHGLYARARSGEIQNFTGVSSPYEAPERPDLVINTAEHSLEESINQLVGVALVKIRPAQT